MSHDQITGFKMKTSSSSSSSSSSGHVSGWCKTEMKNMEDEDEEISVEKIGSQVLKKKPKDFDDYFTIIDDSYEYDDDEVEVSDKMRVKTLFIIPERWHLMIIRSCSLVCTSGLLLRLKLGLDTVDMLMLLFFFLIKVLSLMSSSNQSVFPSDQVTFN